MIALPEVSAAGLWRLRLSVTQRPEPDSLQVDVTHGTDEWICAWTTPLASLGLGAVPRGSAERSSGPARDPAREASLGEPLTALVSSLRSRLSGPLWLELARPKGILPCLPWERWLSPLLDVPVLRLPRYLFKPVRSRGDMHVAWCAGPSSAESPAARIERLRASLDGLERAGARPVFHVFADAALQGEMNAFADGRSGSVVVWPLSADRRYSGTGDGDSPISDPWLRWMCDTLPQGVDLACFDLPGSLMRGRGGLLFSRTPLAGTSEGLRIDGEELTAFLDAAGASGLALCSPLDNPNLSALLALADEIVESRPGPALVHDAAEDPAGKALGDALAFLYGDADPPPVSPRLSIYSHPDRLQKAAGISTAEARPQKPLRDLTVADIIRPAAAPPPPAPAPPLLPQLTRGPLGIRAPHDSRPVKEGFGAFEGFAAPAAETDAAPPQEPAATLPRWLEASQRVLERHVALSAGTQEVNSAVGQAAQKGTEAALRFVKDLLAKAGKGGAS